MTDNARYAESLELLLPHYIRGSYTHAAITAGAAALREVDALRDKLAILEQDNAMNRGIAVKIVEGLQRGESIDSLIERAALITAKAPTEGMTIITSLRAERDALKARLEEREAERPTMGECEEALFHATSKVSELGYTNGKIDGSGNTEDNRVRLSVLAVEARDAESHVLALFRRLGARP